MNEQPGMGTENKFENEKKGKKIGVVKLALMILGGIVLLLLTTVVLLYLLLPEKKPEPQKEIRFYPVVEQNIFENQQYLAKDRSVYYCEDPAGYGRTTVITDADRETLKTLCTAEFLKAQPLPDFTQQMLYDMHIYYQDEEPQEDGSKKFMYRLEYKIFQNNGTYRRDVGSDGAKAEYLVLWVSQDGTDIKIDEIRRS